MANATAFWSVDCHALTSSRLAMTGFSGFCATCKNRVNFYLKTRLCRVVDLRWRESALRADASATLSPRNDEFTRKFTLKFTNSKLKNLHIS